MIELIFSSANPLKVVKIRLLDRFIKKRDSINTCYKFNSGKSRAGRWRSEATTHQTSVKSHLAKQNVTISFLQLHSRLRFIADAWQSVIICMRFASLILEIHRWKCKLDDGLLTYIGFEAKFVIVYWCLS